MDWKDSQSRPGYREKVLQRGSVTITVSRPTLDTEERKARERSTVAALRPIMAGIVAREYRKE